MVKRWQHMLERCNKPNDKSYKNYGRRGIEVCDDWQGRNGFANYFKYISQLENYGKECYTLDRMDNDDNYEPENVRWADHKTQCHNCRNSRQENGQTSKNLQNWQDCLFH